MVSRRDVAVSGSAGITECLRRAGTRVSSSDEDESDKLANDTDDPAGELRDEPNDPRGEPRDEHDARLDVGTDEFCEPEDVSHGDPLGDGVVDPRVIPDVTEADLKMPLGGGLVRVLRGDIGPGRTVTVLRGDSRSLVLYLVVDFVMTALTLARDATRPPSDTVRRTL